MEFTSIRTTWAGEPAYQVIARDMSERRAAEAANSYRASLVAHVSDAIIGIDADGKIESWNEAAQAIYGWKEEEVAGMSISAVVTANRTDSAAVLERGQRIHRRKDGSEVDVLVSIDPLIDDDTQPSGWVVVCTELTDARQAEAGRRAAEERYEAVVASLSEGIVLFDEFGKVYAHNEAASRILGDRLQSGNGHQIFTGASIAIEANGHPLSADMFPHARTLATGESEDDIVIGVTDAGGKRQWLSLSSRLLSGTGQLDVPMVVCSFTDVTDRKAAEAQLHWLAYHDSLTGLGNRSLFSDELERELMVSLQRGTNLAVLFIDLDRFKLVNDSFGHASGDEVLLALAQRFKSAVRGGDVVSRFSGDEFVVLCRNVHDVNVAVSLATEYSRLLAEPVQLSTGRNVVVTCSVGVSFVMRGRQTAQDILQQADVAMFQAKNKGRSRVEVFDESLRAKSVARLEIYDDLRHSIDHDELAVHYQPIASVGDDRIVAMEALVRWHHPSRGLLGPDGVRPLRRGDRPDLLAGPLGAPRGLPDHVHLAPELPGAENAYITVNLSAHQLSDPDLLDTIESAFRDSGLPAEALVMEVTESMLMSDTSASIAMLGGIHEMGVGLAIDDFGTGYSSLAQLKRFPVKILKIDKSFVDGLGTFENDEAIVAAIVQLSKALGLVVLAEGVETPIQLQRVAELGCDLYQGYLMSRPTRADRVDFNKHVSIEPSYEASCSPPSSPARAVGGGGRGRSGGGSSSALPQSFDDGGIGLAAALAHGLKPVTGPGALHLVEERGQQACPGRTGGMPDGDGAAVDVDLVHVRIVLLRPRQHHRGEGLVDLDEIDVRQGELRLGQHQLGGRDHRRQHDDRIVGRHGKSVEPGPRSQAELTGLLLRHDQRGGGSIGDLGRTGRGHQAVLHEAGGSDASFS